MLISKVLNNNVVTIKNEDNQESVVMGRGIAFQKKKGDEIDEEKIDKIFVLKNKKVYVYNIKNYLKEITWL